MEIIISENHPFVKVIFDKKDQEYNAALEFAKNISPKQKLKQVDDKIFSHFEDFYLNVNVTEKSVAFEFSDESKKLYIFDLIALQECVFNFFAKHHLLHIDVELKNNLKKIKEDTLGIFYKWQLPVIDRAFSYVLKSENEKELTDNLSDYKAATIYPMVAEREKIEQHKSYLQKLLRSPVDPAVKSLYTYYLDQINDLLAKEKQILKRFETMDARKDIITMDEKNKLSYLLKTLKPANKETVDRLLVHPNVSIVKYKITNSEALKNLKIKSVSVYADPRINQDAAYNCVVEVTLSSGKKKFMSIHPNLLNLPELKDIFIKNGGQIDRTFAAMGEGALGPSYFEGLNSYTKEMEEDYANIHKELERELEGFIKTAKAPIEIIFIGCGKGEEVKTVLEYLEKSNVPYVIYGMDLDKKNIKLAKNNPAFQNKPIYFKAGDANDFPALINELRHSQNAIHPQSSIAISSGFLTRKVNKGSKDSFTIFKKVANKVDNILISGRTETMIPSHDAKSTGMDVTQRVYYSNKNLRTMDVYSMNDLTQQANKIISKKLAKKIVVLRDHARPIALLKELIRLNFKLTDKSIDLRGAYITSQEDIAFLASLIKDNGIKIIFGNDDAKWAKTLRDTYLLTDKAFLYQPSQPSLFFTSGEGKNFTLGIERPKISPNLRERAEAFKNKK